MYPDLGSAFPYTRNTASSHGIQADTEELIRKTQVGGLGLRQFS